ncbi:MAG: crotonase/enoyl-CoA hydratase family protein [Rhodobacteraceae bacterium]|nr:crotonase/enoyl-CoA hydratase family protein [Paracoccaceae bacterium]
MSDRVSITQQGGIAEVCLQRPAKLNAMDMEMFDALARAGETLAQQAGLRAVILHGAGEGFCAGIDLGMMARMAADLEGLRDEILSPPEGRADNRFQRPCTVWAEVPVPVIAALHGVVFGAGLQLALGADIRIAAPEARLSVMEMKWGLVPDMGLARVLPRLMRADQALELIVTAREFSADQAERMGLVTRVATDPLEAARVLAAEIAGRSPSAISAAKALVAGAWTQADAEALALEARLQAALIGQPHQIEAVMANMERRPARFG